MPKTKDHVCPHCGYEMDHVSLPQNPEGKDMPSKNDVTVCIMCAGIMLFTDDENYVRKPTDEEIAKLKESKESWENLQRVRLAVLLVQTVRDGQNRRQA